MKLIKINWKHLPVYLVLLLFFTYTNNSAQEPGTTENTQLTDTSSFHEIALNFDTSEHKNNIIDSNTVLTEEMLELFLIEEQEMEQNIESWMSDNEYFLDILIEKHVSEEQVENEPEVEGWMTDTEYWK